MYCGKTADWIRMPFGMVSGFGRGMGVLDGVVIVEGQGAVLLKWSDRPNARHTHTDRQMG